MNVLIAGSGYVGGALAQLLRESGVRYGTLSRRGTGAENHTVADLTQPQTLNQIPKTFTHLVYCASAAGYSDESYRSVYVDGLRNILRALAVSPLTRVIFVSSTGVYGQDGGEEVNELSATEPESFSGKRLLEGEKVLSEFSVEGISLRFGGIYGPGRERLLSMIHSQRPVSTQALERYTNRIHRDDCAGSIFHLLKLVNPKPLYLGVDTEAATLRSILEWLCSETGAPFPPIVSGADGVTAEMRGNKRCKSSLLQESGYRFLYPTFREGFGAMIAKSQR